MIKTITLTDEVTKIDFNSDGKNPYFYTSEKNAWIKNKGASAVYVSVSSDCTAGTDGTAEIGSGECVRLGLDRTNCIYASGSGEIEVHTGEICPFKSKAKGGESSLIYVDNLVYQFNYELTTDKAEIDTGIQQSHFKDSGMTVFFKINAAKWDNYYGLMGLHKDAVGYNIQCVDSKISCAMPHYQLNTKSGELNNYIGQTIVFAVSDSDEKGFVAVNGEKIELDASSYRVKQPYDDTLHFLRSYVSTFDDRYFHGTVYSIWLFDRGLSEDEVRSISNTLMEG